MVKNKNQKDFRSEILTNIRYIPLPADKERTAVQGYIMEQEWNKKYIANRMNRLTSATSYTQTSLSPIYIPVNENVLDMRLVRNNLLEKTVMDLQQMNKRINQTTFYDPVLLNPPPKRNLYSGNNFYINLM